MPFVAIDLDTQEVTNIISTTYSISEEGHHTGTVFAGMGGNADEILYGIVHLENENVSLDGTGRAEVFSYNHIDKVSTKIPIELEIKPVYLFGNEERFVTIDYVNLNPGENVGNLYIKASSGYEKYSIPGITAIHDFRESIQLENGLLLCSSYSFYTVIDTKNLAYSRQEMGEYAKLLNDSAVRIDGNVVSVHKYR